MSEEKPLHVRVAEALGWTNVHYRMEKLDHACGDIMIVDKERMRWKGRAPGERLIGAMGCNIIPRYDTDWSATGPLIERYGITLSYLPCTKHDGCDKLKWDAIRDEDGPSEAGDTSLRAVCDLILTLKSAGKLETP